MDVAETLVPLDDDTLHRLLSKVTFYQRLELRASWDASSRQWFNEVEAEREHEYDEPLATLRQYSDDPRVRKYVAELLKSKDHLKRREAVLLMGVLRRSDWLVAALQKVASRDPYQARRMITPTEYSDPDDVEMNMEDYSPLREAALEALGRLG